MWDGFGQQRHCTCGLLTEKCGYSNTERREDIMSAVDRRSGDRSRPEYNVYEHAEG